MAVGLDKEIMEQNRNEVPMKTIVLYKSTTGFTAKYAGWIAEELGCEARPYKGIKDSELAGYDVVIYGGWIMAGMVNGYDKIRNMNLNKVIVFGVGMSVPSDEVVAKMVEQNRVPAEDFFYFEGGYRPEKVGFLKRMMMNMIKGKIQKKPVKTEEDLHMLETFKGGDNTDRAAIEPLIKRAKAAMEER